MSFVPKRKEAYVGSDVSRRSFVEFCGALLVAAPFGLSLTKNASAADIAKTLSHTRKPSVIWLHFQDCTGCSESLLRTTQPDVATLIFDLISLDYHETLMAASGYQAEQALRDATVENAGKYVLVVEGSIPRGKEGEYLRVGGRLGTEILEDSTMGRYAARAIRAAMLADLADKHWKILADNVMSGDLETWRKPSFPEGEIQGMGLHEAPRGLLSHWSVVKNGRIVNYQAVVPTTWNASPRDDKGQLGPYEASLIGTPIAQSDKPLEVLRTIHSYDPCMACACHAFDPDGRPLSTVKVL